MRKRWLIGLLGATGALTAALFALAGCGGGGGPITPPSVPPGPSVSQDFLKLLPAGQQGATYVGTDKCLSCHETGAHGAPQIDAASWKQTKHFAVSVGCEQCHGPGSNHANAATPTEDTILSYPNLTRSEVCAQCHGPMANDFKNSKHAEPVEEVVEESIGAAGASTGKTCLRCHSAPMRVEMIEEPLAQGKSRQEVDAAITALSADKVTELAEATHETASCVTCHDPMRATNNGSWKPPTPPADGKIQLRWPETTTDTTDIGYDANGNYLGPSSNTAVTHTTVPQTCARCHNGRSNGNTDDRLRASSARPNFHEGPQFNMLMGVGGSEYTTINGAAQFTPPSKRNTAHATAPGQCSHCHMPNAKHTMIVNLDASCAPCHTPQDAAARYAIRGSIELRLVALRTRMENWAKATLGNSALWDYSTLVPAGVTAPNQADPPTGKIPIEIKRARHNFYFVLRDASMGVHNSSYTRHLLDVADKNLDALGVSRAATVALNAAQARNSLKADILRARRAALQPDL